MVTETPLPADVEFACELMPLVANGVVPLVHVIDSPPVGLYVGEQAPFDAAYITVALDKHNNVNKKLVESTLRSRVEFQNNFLHKANNEQTISNSTSNAVALPIK